MATRRVGICLLLHELEYGTANKNKCGDSDGGGGGVEGVGGAREPKKLTAPTLRLFLAT